MGSLSKFVATVHSRGLGATVGAAVNAVRVEIDRRRGCRFVERKIYGRRMLLDLEDRGISRTLLLFGERELEHKVILERVLEPGMSVLDIGANIGYYALMELALIGAGGSLIAVEPSPSNVSLLRQNLALNGHDRIEVHQLAISDSAATRPFFMSTMSNLNTFHDTGTGALHLEGGTIDVTTTTVPDLMAGRRLDLIRMDVEGHELEVLAGLLPAVERDELAPMVIFETHQSRYTPDHDIVPVLRRYFLNGYRVALAGSSSERGTVTVQARGYKSSAPIRTDDVQRVIFENIENDDALDFISRTGGLRTVLLARR